MEAGGNNDDFEFLKPLCSPPKTAVQHPRLSLILSDVRDHKQIEVRLGCFVLAMSTFTHLAPIPLFGRFSVPQVGLSCGFYVLRNSLIGCP